MKIFSEVAVNSSAEVGIGEAKRIMLCIKDGKAICVGSMMRIAEDELAFTSGPSYRKAYIFENGSHDATRTQASPNQFINQLQVPNPLYVLEKATLELLHDICFMCFLKTPIENEKFYVFQQSMLWDLGSDINLSF
jgi:hypothetical protein